MIKHKKKPSQVGPWKQFRDLNIYANRLGEIKYKQGKSEYLFEKMDFYSRNNTIAQEVIHTKHKRYFVKRIVWECFNGEIPKGYGITHINGLNRCDELSNLKLVKISDYCKETSGKHAKRFVIDKTNNKVYKGAESAARALHICKSSIVRYCNKKIRNPLYELEWGGLVSGKDL